MLSPTHLFPIFLIRQFFIHDGLNLLLLLMPLPLPFTRGAWQVTQSFSWKLKVKISNILSNTFRQGGRDCGRERSLSHQWATTTGDTNGLYSGQPHRTAFEGTSCLPLGAFASPRASCIAHRVCSEPNPALEHGCLIGEGSASHKWLPCAEKERQQRRVGVHGIVCNGKQTN